MSSRKFLGRDFDPNSNTYAFKDGSGRVPEEMRQDLFDAVADKNSFGGNGIPVLGTLFSWKDRLADQTKMRAAAEIGKHSAPSKEES